MQYGTVKSAEQSERQQPLLHENSLLYTVSLIRIERSEKEGVALAARSQ